MSVIAALISTRDGAIASDGRPRGVQQEPRDSGEWYVIEDG